MPNFDGLAVVVEPSRGSMVGTVVVGLALIARDALRGGLAFDGSGFPLDSLFCEWGYLVDFDSRTFEVYRGLQTTPPTAGRFVDRPTVRDGRFPMTLVASWPLVALPDEGSFMALPGAY